MLFAWGVHLPVSFFSSWMPDLSAWKWRCKSTASSWPSPMSSRSRSASTKRRLKVPKCRRLARWIPIPEKVSSFLNTFSSWLKGNGNGYRDNYLCQSRESLQRQNIPSAVILFVAASEIKLNDQLLSSHTLWWILSSIISPPSHYNSKIIFQLAVITSKISGPIKHRRSTYAHLLNLQPSLCQNAF